MNVLVFATTFGGDLWSFVRYLDERPDVTVRVEMSDPESFRQSPVAAIHPLRADLIPRKGMSRIGANGDWKPDLTLLDNLVPFRRTSPAALMLWHGFGWKGPNDVKEFRWLHWSIKSSWGDVRKPNPRFTWSCFGDWDFDHRSTVSGIHPENCRILGSATHDWLRDPVDRRLAQPFYPFDILGRKTVLIAPTWHYGEVFAHWGRDAGIFETILSHVESLGANVILRFHDSFRYDAEYVRWIRGLPLRYPHVMVKFKDTDPDNYIDMQVSDVLATNFSSIANLFYATGRPSVHIYPVRDADEEFIWRTYTVRGVRSTRVSSARYVWKLPPEENGGLLVRNLDELIADLERSLADPDCCRERSAAFLDKYMIGADSRNCERAWTEAVRLVESN